MLVVKQKYMMTDKNTQRKYYAVKIGKVPGIYNTWAECANQVLGFSGSNFKAFSVLQDAQEFLGMIKKDSDSGTSGVLDIYTDGTYKSGTLGIGAWCKYEGHEYILSKRLTGDFLGKEYGINIDKCSSPTAEFIAVAEVIKRIRETTKFKQINIYTDYLGPEMWLCGQWNIKNTEIKKIYEIVKKLMENLKFRLEFHHVAGHTNSPGNTKADSICGNITAQINNSQGTFDTLGPFLEKFH
jgi:ribonuclease H-related protein